MLKSGNSPFEVTESVKRLGESIRIARLRRRMRQEDLAEKCNITRKTLYGIESGLPGIAVGNIFAVLWVLGLLDTTRFVADPDQDEHGKILEAAHRPRRAREIPELDNDF